MDDMDARGSDVDIDLESGGTTSDEDGVRYPGSNERHVGKSWSGLVGLERSIRCGESSGSHNNVLSSDDVLVDNVEMVNLVGKKMVTDKRKKTSSKGSSKPPRPPRGPSLDSADMKWVREFSELAALKRKRVERLKSVRKAKADKASPLNSNLCAMVVTAIFCFVIIFQGLLGSRV
ncbi:hypothetical protein RHMOL_Rhmol11G0157000 [Rhododendron molle]|uniref:Uncharacterized protein n=2 Tax=Rhododendron molle TaxID=49168 RepID=A0ACC0LSN2_RHOML|nr:hypothetical protein RHMOL_Rhmol11G0157000 [Rhododendron molle]KAI8531717.1 hypothetical protein RHMOL_Rhmol11G0157000 [Rhododendron molle]